MKHFKQRFRSIINKAKKKTYPGADIDLVLMSLTLKLKTEQVSNTPRFALIWRSLKNQMLWRAFHAVYRFATPNLVGCDVDILTGNIKVLLLSTT